MLNSSKIHLIFSYKNTMTSFPKKGSNTSHLFLKTVLNFDPEIRSPFIV